jgi:phage tail sheath protein FI
MAAPMKTPGVYIVEKSAFPNSVVEVATAVPAFIGYTEKADNKGKSLLNKPWKISSMAEFHNYFGAGCKPVFGVRKAEEGDEADFLQRVGDDEESTMEEYVIEQKAGKYLLYNSMKLFFSNGGGPCYIVSVGAYGKEDQSIDAGKLAAGIETLIKEQEPTMVVVPDVCRLAERADAIAVQQASLLHCGEKMKNRVSILDIYDGYRDRKDPAGDPVEDFRNELGTNNLDYGMAYYPWINTSIVQDNELDYRNFETDSIETLKAIIATDLGLGEPANQNDKQKAMQSQIDQLDKVTTADWISGDGDEAAERAEAPVKMRLLQSSLVQNSAAFKIIMDEARNKLNLLPPGAAMAGIFTRVDNASGVWKAPANVSLNAVISPTVNISHDDQQDLNVTPQGKSINAIRSFIGEGTLVWGARTLDGNSLDWRYIQVRRTMIMLEESIKLAAKAYVFDNNEANTWITIKSMIRNFLNGIWKRGGLAGSSPDDAFTVMVGLGETMTPEDILEGILRVTVLVALIRPAEFIEITFQQQMQKS